jgi:hypothetical protein
MERTMGFFGMLFWIVVLWFVIRALHRSDRCVAIEPRGYWPGWYRRDRYDMPDARAKRTRPDAQQEYIDSLESRLSELEERLDFTERLLANRQEPTR